MRNDPTGANGEAMPAITRRAVLTTGAAAAAMATVPAASAPASPISAELADLIAKTLQAVATWEATIDPLEHATDVWKAHVKANPLPMVPYFGGAIETGLFDREQMHREIREKYREQAAAVAPFTKMDPTLAEAMTATLRTKEAENHALADRIHDDKDRRMADFGLTAAEEAYEATSDAWEQALWDLLEYDTTSLAEERARAAAIIGNTLTREIMIMDERFSSGLLYTVAGIAHPDAEV
ncbi:hypothetical protein H9Q09_22200 [Aurantimonas sp. DM33-3]|uniref:hypothetical protein n=1 Tax=Aurantimonas sp. DM33-3 TaxID=2766955 RepID=UPI0016525B2D|nr:hypothetical protein [Aurantimonas sp. DM33-3]MBC6718883.1 hypothetical protein [Aurantimonas sp. DM33-3]